MFLLVLRIVTAPLVVLGATLVQRRFGNTISGLVVGLPLSTMALLWLVTLQHSHAFTASMADSILAASSAQVVVIWLYARLAQRFSATVALLGTLAAFVVVAGPFIEFDRSMLWASALAVGATVLALHLWPRTSAVSSEDGRYRLGLRLVIAAVVTVALVSLSGRIGPALSGLAGALPVMSLTMAYVTHRELGAKASAQFLEGVTRGSYSYVLAMFVLTGFLRSGDVAQGFLAALVVALAVQLVVHLWSSTPYGHRALAFVVAFSRSHVDRLAPENFRAVWPSGHRTLDSLSNS